MNKKQRFLNYLSGDHTGWVGYAFDGLNQFLIDSCGGNEEVIRAEVRRCIDENAPGGSFLPCYPSVMPVDMNAMSIAVDEMNRYGQIWLEKNA